MVTKRRLRRFFSENLPPVGSQIKLSLEETSHLKKSLRLAPGDHCLVADGAGREAKAKVVAFLPSDQALLTIEELYDKNSTISGDIFFRLHIALIQKNKMEFLLEKCQELGLDEICPLETDRSTWKLKPEAGKRVMERWRKKSREAVKQSGSSRLTRIEPVQTLGDALSSLGGEGLTAVFHPGSGGVKFKDWVETVLREKGAGKVKQLDLFFGPEGGFSNPELKDFETHAARAKQKIQYVDLGENILRVETAVLGVLTALKLLLS